MVPVDEVVWDQSFVFSNSVVITGAMENSMVCTCEVVVVMVLVA